MRCPECGSGDFVRYRSPVEVGDYTVRRHRCQSCSSTFLSIQYVLEGRLAENLLSDTDWKALKASDRRSPIYRAIRSSRKRT